MSGAARSGNGSKMVVAAVTATVAALGFGTVYLPFIADKDRVRGMHEEGEMSARDKREYEKMLREMGHHVDANKQQGGQGGPPSGPPRMSNSMWQRMNDASGK